MSVPGQPNSDTFDLYAGITPWRTALHAHGSWWAQSRQRLLSATAVMSVLGQLRIQVEIQSQPPVPSSRERKVKIDEATTTHKASTYLAGNNS